MVAVDQIYWQVLQEDIDTNPDVARDCTTPGWYFTDETDNFGGGPYDTLDECRDAAARYAKECL